MQTTKLTRSQGQKYTQGLSISDRQHTRILFNLSARVCNHTLHGCCGFRACGTCSVTVQSLLQTAHYRLRDMLASAPRFLLHIQAADQRAPLLHLCVCTDGLLGSDLKSCSLPFTHSHVTSYCIRLTSLLSETNKLVCGVAKPSKCSAPC